MAEKILILGGAGEAMELAKKLTAEGHDVTTSLAGRTREPAPVAGKLRVGGFGGADGLADYLAAGGFTRLIDATHPFATRISANARVAARRCGIAIERIERLPWKKEEGDDWLEFATLQDIREAIPPGARAMLALGSQHIGAFASRADVFFLVRMVDAPTSPPPLADHRIVLGRPGDTDAEAALLAEHRITHLVCRNSGGALGYGKIEAARRLRLPVLMLRRPDGGGVA